MRSCPVCSVQGTEDEAVMVSHFKVPDGWPLPSEITWYSCIFCGMCYGDGDFDQAMLDDYYRNFYGYGVNSPENVERLKRDAERIAISGIASDAVIVDFGGAGDDGRSILVDELHRLGFPGAVCIGPKQQIPKCDLLFASHVIEHIYDLRETMDRIAAAVGNGWLVIDGPDSTGIALHWPMPMLDWNTKHINHFTLRDYLNLGWQNDFEMIDMTQYVLGGAPAYQMRFRRQNTAALSAGLIETRTLAMLEKLRQMKGPVNIWGLGDITWHLLAEVDLDVLNYIDNDPAYRGQKYNGQPVLERPDNDAPIVILAQGQRKRLVENIRKMGVLNRIIEI